MTNSTYRYSSYPKDVHHDGPCTNIILQSDCMMRSNQYNYSQKEITQNENKTVLINNENIITTDLRASHASCLNSFNKRHDNVGFITENRYNMTLPVRRQCEVKYDQDNEKLTFNQISQIADSSNALLPFYFINFDKISNTNKTQTLFDSARRKLTYYTKDRAAVKQMIILNRETTKPATLVGKTKTKTFVNVNKYQVENSVKSCKELFRKTSPLMKLESSFGKINEDKTTSITTKTDLSNLEVGNKRLQDSEKMQQTDMKSSLRQTMKLEENAVTFAKADVKVNYTNTLPYSEVKSIANSFQPISNRLIKSKQLKDLLSEQRRYYFTHTNHNFTNYSTLNTGQDIKYGNTNIDVKSMGNIMTNNYLKPEANFYFSKSEKEPVNTVDTILNPLQSILKEIKKLNNKTIVNCNTRDYQHRDVKCKNINCNVKNVKNVKNTKSEVTALDSFTTISELLKPECLRILKEIKKCTKTLEEQLILMNKNMNIKKKVSEKVVPFTEYSINVTSNIKNIHNIKQQRDMFTQKPEKENISIQEPSQSKIRYVKCVQDILSKSKNNIDSHKVKKITVATQKIHKRRTHTEQINRGNKNDTGQQRNKNDEKEYHNFYNNVIKSNNLKKIQNVQGKQTWSVPCFILDHSNLRPLATSTPIKTNLLGNKNCFCHISCSSQTSALFNGNLETKQIKGTTLKEVMSYPLKREGCAINLTHVNGKQESSCCQEKTIMILLTKGVNNTHLKSKYKKLEFMNFRPTCIINSCVMRNQRLIKSRFSQSKVQIPTVFRQLKSVQCKVNKFVDSSKHSHGNFTNQSLKDCKVSELLTTVYTQSSNLYITTATSISCITFNDRNYSREKVVETGTCVLC